MGEVLGTFPAGPDGVMMRGDLQLSVVIPAYNEAHSLRRTIEAVERYLTASRVSHEIVIVDDGSTDWTVATTGALAVEHASVRLLRSAHQGKGGAVKQGVLAAQGEVVLFMDADHSTRIEEWAKFVPWLQEGFEVLIGSRRIPGAEVRAHQPPLREAMGKGFTWLTNALLTVRVTDVTCGFKGFQAEAARAIFQRQRMPGWSFDAEILFIARRLGYRLKEVPVVWTDDASTKVHLVADTLWSLRELLAIRLGGWRGWYA